VFDSTLYFSAARAITGLHPPIDPLRSESRLLAAAGPLGSRHVKAALGVRRIMREAAQMTAAPVSLFLTPPSLTQGARRPPDENELAVKAAPAHALERARRLDRYFAQPFYVSEGATGMAGTHVGVGEALGACEELLEGDGAPVVGETEMTGVRTLQGHDVRWISGDRVAVEGEVAPLRVAYDRSEK
jgi:F-type H+-transporting ATPase subunit beta